MIVATPRRGCGGLQAGRGVSRWLAAGELHLSGSADGDSRSGRVQAARLWKPAHADERIFVRASAEDAWAERIRLPESMCGAPRLNEPVRLADLMPFRE